MQNTRHSTACTYMYGHELDVHASILTYCVHMQMHARSMQLCVCIHNSQDSARGLVGCAPFHSELCEPRSDPEKLATK